MWTISVPLRVTLKSGKPYALNLNIYRNTHHYMLNEAKVAFKEEVQNLLKDIPLQNQVRLTYTLFPATKRLVDVANVCSIVDKFFSDVLVACKVIADDNHTVVLSTLYRYGSVCKDNPRVEVTIEPVSVTGFSNSDPNPQREDNKMQITIVQTEIEEAIKAHILSQISVKDNTRIDIDLKATRGAEGFQAVIDIVSADAPSQARTQAAPVREQAAPQVSSKPLGLETQIRDAQGSETTQAQNEADSVQEDAEGPVENGGTAGNSSSRGSLFAGLNKPVNTPTEAVEA